MVTSDRHVKIPLYAKGGIPKVLLIDIPGKGVENYTEPRDGCFTNVQRLMTGRGRLVNFEDMSIEVSELLGEERLAHRSSYCSRSRTSGFFIIIAEDTSIIAHVL